MSAVWPYVQKWHKSVQQGRRGQRVKYNVELGYFFFSFSFLRFLPSSGEHIFSSIAVFIALDDVFRSHLGQPPCRGGGALHRWPKRFLKSGGEELTKRWPKRESRLLHVISAFVLVSASQPITASQPSIYGFTAVCLRLHSRLRLYSRYL